MKLPVYTDAMCDIETTGLSPDRNAIIQIACVKFNVETLEVSPDVFNECLEMPPTRFWDEGTRNWWHNPDRVHVLYEQILPRAISARTAMERLVEWAQPAGHLSFWGKPTHFDYSFISSYFKDFGLPEMFSYRKANDMNSFLRGLYFPNQVPKLDVPFDGDVHNALSDTFHQVSVLLHHVMDARRPAQEILEP